MRQMIQLTTADSKTPFYVNPDNISALYQNDGFTIIHYVNHSGNAWAVKENSRRNIRAGKYRRDQSLMLEPKSDSYWIAKGFRFIELSSCLACGAPVSVWESPAGKHVPLDAKTLESHFSSCPRAKEYRTEERMRAGVL